MEPLPFAVMISHSSKERPIADAVCQRLEAAGFPCWIAPRNIPAGAEWTTSILEGIASSRMMVLVFSGSANDSKHVAREVHYAGDNHKPVLPFRVQKTNPTGGIAYYLLGVQWLDAWSLPLEPHLDVLVSRVRRLLSEDAAGPDPAGEPAAVGDAPPCSETDVTFKCPVCGELMIIEATGIGLQVECTGCGRPVTVPGIARDTIPGPLALTAAAREALAERLGAFVGPIARHLLKTVAARVDTVPELCQKLAEFIPDKKDREAFLESSHPDPADARAPGIPSKPPPSSVGPENPAAAWPPGALDALQKGLAHYLGPMAGHIVDEAAGDAHTLDQLHDLLAAKISSPKDRAEWRKSLTDSRH